MDDIEPNVLQVSVKISEAMRKAGADYIKVKLNTAEGHKPVEGHFWFKEAGEEAVENLKVED